jgi:hypothetical protein
MARLFKTDLRKNNNILGCSIVHGGAASVLAELIQLAGQ